MAVPLELKEEQRGSIKTIQIVIAFTDFKPVQKVYLDDAVLFKLP